MQRGEIRTTGIIRQATQLSTDLTEAAAARATTRLLTKPAESWELFSFSFAFIRAMRTHDGFLRYGSKSPGFAHSIDTAIRRAGAPSLNYSQHSPRTGTWKETVAGRVLRIGQTRYARLRRGFFVLSIQGEYHQAECH